MSKTSDYNLRIKEANQRQLIRMYSRKSKYADVYANGLIDAYTAYMDQTEIEIITKIMEEGKNCQKNS